MRILLLLKRQGVGGGVGVVVVARGPPPPPARLFGRRAGVHSQPPSRATRSEHLTGKVEIFLTREIDSETWEALVRPGRKMQVGERVLFGEWELEAEVLSPGELGLRTLRFISHSEASISRHFALL